MTRARGVFRRGPTPAVAEKQHRDRWATAGAVLAWLSVLVGVAPHWLVGTSFIECEWGRHSLKYLVSHDVRWALALAATLGGPIWFWWWRRSAMGVGAAIGVAISAAAAVSVTLCVVTADMLDAPAWAGRSGTYPLLMAAGVVSAAAFLIAPAPRDPESLNALQVRGLVRRSRRRSETKRRIAPASPEQRRERLALATSIVVGIVTVFCLAPLWFLVRDFVEVGQFSLSFTLAHLVVHDPLWRVAGCATTFASAWYWAWRHWRVPAGGSIGAVLAATGVAATVFGLAEGHVSIPAPRWSWGSTDLTIRGGMYGLLLAAGIVHVLAFIVAPAPDAAAARTRSRPDTRPASLAYALCLAGASLLVPLVWLGMPLVRHVGGWPRRDPDFSASFLELVTTDISWASGAGTLAFAPVLLLVWQKTAISYGRVCGIAASAVGGLALSANLVAAYADTRTDVQDPAWMLPFTAAAFVAAFVVAPEPRHRNAVDAAEVGRLLRRHRAQITKR